MFITGPQVIKAVTGEEVTPEELGGATAHNQKSGVAHFISQSEEKCFEQIRKLLSFIPSNNLEDPPYKATTDDPTKTVPRTQYNSSHRSKQTLRYERYHKACSR